MTISYETAKPHVRACPRVSDPMYPSRTRDLLPVLTTENGADGFHRSPPRTFGIHRAVPSVTPRERSALNIVVEQNLNTILGLLHERAATVSELAVALERPKSTVAHHVKVLNEAGLVQVVRTRRVRAIEERFYGRTARMFYVAVERSTDGDDLPREFNDFEVAARESSGAYRAENCGASSGTPGSRRRRPRSSGSGWRSSWRSSSGFRARARPCMDSRSASIPPTKRRFRAANDVRAHGPSRSRSRTIKRAPRPRVRKLIVQRRMTSSRFSKPIR